MPPRKPDFPHEDVAAEPASLAVSEAERRRLLETIVTGMEDFAFVFDLEGRLLFANRRLLALWGKTLEEIVGGDGADLGYPAWQVELHRREIRQIVRTKRPVRGEIPCASPGGEFRVHEYILAPAMDASGEVQAIVGTSRDITHRKQGELRDCFLLELDDALRPLADQSDITMACARLLGEYLAVDRCVYAYFEGDEVHIIGDYTRDVQSIVGRYKLSDFGEAVTRQLLNNEVFVSADIEAHVTPVNDLTPYRELGVRAMVAVPLHKERQLVAGIAVQHGAPRVWSTDDVLLVQSVASRCWESIERARVTAILREREALYRFLSDISELSRIELEADVVMKTAVQKIAGIFGAARCAYAEVSEDEENFTVRGDFAAEGSGSVSEYRLAQFGERVPAEQRAGIVSVVHDVARELGNEAREFEALNIRALVCCPLVRRGRLRAMIGLHQPTPRRWTQTEVTSFRTAVERCWAEAERARAARALVESERAFRHLADAMPQIVFIARPDGTIDYFNRRWYDYTGLPSAEEVDESRWVSVIDPDERERVGRLWAESLATGRPYEVECRVRRHDGEWRWHLGRAVPIRDEVGNIVRWFGTDTDIHEQRTLLEQNQRLLENERLARSEAERVGRMKDEFLATLSHELRTPLSAIVGWTEVLREDTRGTALNEIVETIARNADAQIKIVEELLDMSRITSGKIRLDVQPLDLATVVKLSIDTLRPAADAKGVRLQAILSESIGPTSGDANRLHQVFWNLLSNAIKFTAKGGHVQVVLERVNSQAQVSVIDSGEGIAPDFLPFVFDRFRQADGSTTRRHGGLGLGLSIVRQLVELHGGSVNARSPGLHQGAEFTVKLPLIAAHREAAEPADQSEVRGRGAALPGGPAERLDGVSVLVVDDEADARALLKRVLEDRGARIFVAASAAEAMQVLDAQKPGVIVSDIGMPGEDGYAFIRRVRLLEDARGGRTPAVALTAYARTTDRIDALRAGFQMHLVKPVEPAELTVVIASLVAAGK